MDSGSPALAGVEFGTSDEANSSFTRGEGLFCLSLDSTGLNGSIHNQRFFLSLLSSWVLR